MNELRDKGDAYYNVGEEFGKYLEHSKQPEVERLFLDGISRGAKYERALDVGCASGRTTLFTKRHGVEELVGIEIDPRGAEIARQHLDEVFCADVATFELDRPREYFDIVFFTDILEHLVDPWAVLDKYLEYLKPGGHALVVLPNAAHIHLVGALLLGNYEYQESGLLDWGHLRCFTQLTAGQMLRDAGLRVDRLLVRSDAFEEDSDGFVDVTKGGAIRLQVDPRKIPEHMRKAWFVRKFNFLATKI